MSTAKAAGESAADTQSGLPTGFDATDFDIFEVPAFHDRMPLLRARIKPKLIQLGEHLNSPVSAALGEQLYTHVAQHMRRTVNPPEATWVAFSRSARAYKPFVHVRVAISAESVRTSVFVEDYAEDKALFIRNLEQQADRMAEYFEQHPQIMAYNIPGADGEPLSGISLNATTLREFAARMRRVKGQHAVFGIDISRKQVIRKSGKTLTKAVVAAVKTLRPLYEFGKV